MRGPITPWEFGAKKDLVVAAPYEYVSSSNQSNCTFFLNHSKNKNCDMLQY